MDKERIKSSVRAFLEAIGENPDREGLIETPERVAKMCEEVFAGIQYSNEDIVKLYGKCFTTNTSDMVIMRDIDVFSYCEHHLALMYNMKITVAYIPHGKVIGLSKIARICDMAAKRLQLQEKLGNDIAEIIQLATGSDDVAVIISGSHSCMTARGIKKLDAKTFTQTFRGAFKNNSALQERVMR